ncbi:MAG: HoxN/HupN/NixA family nickel/cobalt transporter [Tepidisphaeraceae bacterium]|jgi:high-affinity nickel-transport protein
MRGFSRRLVSVGLLLLGINLIIWAAALLTFHHYPLLLGFAAEAFTLGLAHALDADHISAIDNVTRKLMQEGKRPMLVGFFFSVGHSTIVILLSLAIAITAARIQSRFDGLERMGNVLGTAISALFLFGIALINLLVLRGVVQTFRGVKRGEQYVDQDLDGMLSNMGAIGRMVRPMIRLVDASWKMYFVGFLFGLGFDTATQVGLLGIAAAAGTQGVPIWSILIFPLLFTAGMCIVDTADGILMLGAYGWAFVHPVRKLYYNMTITAVSVFIALVVGGIEVLSLVSDQFNLQGPFWDRINGLDFVWVGVTIIGIFVCSWILSIFAYRALGYKRLELAVAESFAAPLPNDTPR